MHLTLFVPDLLWPDVANPAAFNFPGANELAKALALSKRSRLPMGTTDSWESQLTTLFGFDDRPLPLAALRSLGADCPSPGRILCADPVNLSFIQQSLVLSPIAGDTLSDAEAQSLLVSLNEEFAEEGHFMTGAGQQHTTQWYFVPHSEATVLPNLAACSRLAGRRVDADETRRILGRDALKWLNRIQMCLNQHPVNEAREALGLPAINSLWPWGLGQLDQTPLARFAQASGNTEILSGLCRVTQTPLTGSDHFTAASGHQLVVELGLAQAIRDDDLTAWQSAMTALITHWISPALSALTQNPAGLESLTLISPGATHQYTWVLGRTTKGLSGNWLQRILGRAPKAPDLHSLLQSWSA